MKESNVRRKTNSNQKILHNEQLNTMGLRARQDEVQLLMNNIQPSCICLEEVVLENIKYILVRKYEFYSTDHKAIEARERQQSQTGKKYNTKG